MPKKRAMNMMVYTFKKAKPFDGSGNQRYFGLDIGRYEAALARDTEKEPSYILLKDTTRNEYYGQYVSELARQTPSKGPWGVKSIPIHWFVDRSPEEILNHLFFYQRQGGLEL